MTTTTPTTTPSTTTTIPKSNADQLNGGGGVATTTQENNAVLVQNSNGLVASIDLYNCGQENGGFDFSGFDVAMMTGGNAQTAGTASPVGGVVPSVNLLPPQSCVSATAITPSVTQAVGLPDEVKRVVCVLRSLVLVLIYS